MASKIKTKPSYMIQMSKSITSRALISPTQCLSLLPYRAISDMYRSTK